MLEMEVVENRTYAVFKASCIGVDKALRKLAFDTEAKTKKNINANDAIDTSSYLNSVYVDLKGTHTYEAAAAKAKQAAAQAGAKSKRANTEFKMLPPLMAGEFEAIVAIGAAHGANVELGTVKMAARPALIPAAREIAKTADYVIAAIANNEIK